MRLHVCDQVASFASLLAHDDHIMQMSRIATAREMNSVYECLEVKLKVKSRMAWHCPGLHASLTRQKTSHDFAIFVVITYDRTVSVE